METNCGLKNDLDISGEKHAERVALKFKNLLSDTWKLFVYEKSICC